MRNSSAAATRAAVSVTRTTSRRTSSRRARIGAASRQMPTTPTHLAVRAQGKELVQDGRRSQRPAGAGAGRSAGPMSAPAPAEAPGERARRRRAGAGGAARRGDDGSVGTTELDPDDLARLGQRRELRVEPVRPRSPSGAPPVEDGRRDIALTNARVVAASLPTTSFSVDVEKCVRRDRLRGRRDPDDRQERAEDEQQQERTGRARASRTRAEAVVMGGSWPRRGRAVTARSYRGPPPVRQGRVAAGVGFRTHGACALRCSRPLRSTAPAPRLGHCSTAPAVGPR